MTHEASKSMTRRSKNAWWQSIFKGEGVDIGAGNDCIDQHHDKFPKITGVRNWDLKDGDAQYMESVEDNTYDFVHSSHCLEHMRDPHIAIANWIRIVKPGGYVVVTIPDWEMYEHRQWPSRYNTDHKTSWTLYEERCEDGRHIIHLPSFCEGTARRHKSKVARLEAITEGYDPTNPGDQTLSPSGPECALEFVLQKKG